MKDMTIAKIMIIGGMATWFIGFLTNVQDMMNIGGGAMVLALPAAAVIYAIERHMSK